MNKFIDTHLAVLIAALVLWWLLAGTGNTPAEQIYILENTVEPSAWMDALRSDDRVVRQFARDNVLEKLPVESLEPIALDAVKGDDEQQVLAGLWILAKADIESRGILAGDFIDSGSDEIVEAALDVLAVDPVPELRERLVELTENERVSTRDAALKALSAIQNPDDLSLFISHLGSTRINTRDICRIAIIALAPSTPHLLSALIGVAYDTDLFAARESIKIIGQLDDPDALDTLFDYLEFGPVGLSSEAANAIANSDDPDASDRALQLFLNAGGRTRNQAARVLGAIGNTEAQNYLWSTVTDNSEEFWLRYYSMEALGTCGTAELVPEIIEYIENVEPDDRIIRAGLESIGGMGGEDVFVIYDAIIDGEIDFGLNRSGGNQAMVSTINGLGKMTSGDAQAGARERLHSLSSTMGPGDIELIMAIVRAFGDIGTRDDFEVISELEDISPVIHGVVSEALTSIETRYPENSSGEPAQ